MDEQPTTDEKPEATPTERAFIEMTAHMQNLCFRFMSREFGGAPALINNFAGIVASQKVREVEMLALVELLHAAKVINRDQWMNRAAAIGEQYAATMAAGLAAEADAKPRIAIATSLNGRH